MKNLTAQSAAFIVLCISASTPVVAEEFHLLCTGGGVGVKPSTATVQNYNLESATVHGTQVRPYSGEISVDIVDGVGRVRLPPTILPGIHSGKDGWFNLDDTKIGEAEISAKVGVNFMNHPTMRINRVTGAISIDGKAGNFSGTCQPYDPATVQRAF